MENGNNKKNTKEAIDELQMLTGLSSRDVTLMYYHLVKDGTYFKKKEDNKIHNEGITLGNFDDWFEML